MSERHIKEHIMAMIEGFLIDPPGNNYQAGFLAGLLDLATDIGMSDPSLLRAALMLMDAAEQEPHTVH